MDNRLPPAAPGTERPRRYRPQLRYELIGCGLHGHELLGTDAAALRPEDVVFAREADGLRWYRCMRCDAWVALSPPSAPTADLPPAREDIVLPLRGQPLRDRYVLRLIALDRLLHFLVLSALAAALFLFAGDRAALDADFTRILADLQGGLGGPQHESNHGVVYDLQRLFAVNITNLYLAASAVAAYAALEGAEAVGLWQGRRWAEYLTFLATVIFVPYEVYELTKSVSALKILTLVINVAIVAYLLAAKRLFGLRGGGRAARALHEADTGWGPVERATPRPSRPAAARMMSEAQGTGGLQPKPTGGGVMSGFADDAKEAEKLAENNAGTVDKGVQEGEKLADQHTGDRFDKEIGEAGQELENQIGNGNGNGNGQQNPEPNQPADANQSGT